MKRQTAALLVLLAVLVLACTCSSVPDLMATDSGTRSSDQAAAATKDGNSNPFPFATEDGNGNPEPTYEEIETPSGPVNGKVGEPVQNGKLSIIVHGWVTIPDDIQTPEAGKSLIAVDLTVLYTGKKSFNFSSSNYSLKDSDGRIYQESNSGMQNGVVSYATLFAGERLHTTLRFQIPKSSSGLTFVYEGSSYEGFAKMFIPLGDAPGIKNPPDTMEGEIAPDVRPADSAQTCGKWKVQVFDQQYPQVPDFFMSNIPSGWKILALDLAVENGYANTHNLNSYSSMWIQDGSGRRYSEGYARAVIDENYFSADEMAAGEKIRGWKGFTVPEKVSLALVFWCGGEKSPYAQDKVFIGLSKK